MKVVSADSAAAILDDQFKPLVLVASASVLVEPPYREAQTRLTEPLFKKVEDGYEVIVHEAQLCQALLETVKADVVHLDTSLGGFPIDELSPVELANMNLSSKARAHLLKDTAGTASNSRRNPQKTQYRNDCYRQGKPACSNC